MVPPSFPKESPQNNYLFFIEDTKYTKLNLRVHRVHLLFEKKYLIQNELPEWSKPHHMSCRFK